MSSFHSNTTSYSNTTTTNNNNTGIPDQTRNKNIYNNNLRNNYINSNFKSNNLSNNHNNIHNENNFVNNNNTHSYHNNNYNNNNNNNNNYNNYNKNYNNNHIIDLTNYGQRQDYQGHNSVSLPQVQPQPQPQEQTSPQDVSTRNTSNYNNNYSHGQNMNSAAKVLELERLLEEKTQEIFELNLTLATVEAETKHRLELAETQAQQKIKQHLFQNQLLQNELQQTQQKKQYHSKRKSQPPQPPPPPPQADTYPLLKDPPLSHSKKKNKANEPSPLPSPPPIIEETTINDEDINHSSRDDVNARSPTAYNHISTNVSSKADIPTSKPSVSHNDKDDVDNKKDYQKISSNFSYDDNLSYFREVEVCHQVAYHLLLRQKYYETILKSLQQLQLRKRGTSGTLPSIDTKGIDDNCNSDNQNNCEGTTKSSVIMRTNMTAKNIRHDSSRNHFSDDGELLQEDKNIVHGLLLAMTNHASMNNHYSTNDIRNRQRLDPTYSMRSNLNTNLDGIPFMVKELLCMLLSKFSTTTSNLGGHNGCNEEENEHYSINSSIKYQSVIYIVLHLIDLWQISAEARSCTRDWLCHSYNINHSDGSGILSSSQNHENNKFQNHFARSPFQRSASRILSIPSSSSDEGENQLQEDDNRAEITENIHKAVMILQESQWTPPSSSYHITDRSTYRSGICNLYDNNHVLLWEFRHQKNTCVQFINVLRSFLLPESDSFSVDDTTTGSNEDKSHDVLKHNTCDSHYQHYLKKKSINIIQILLSDAPSQHKLNNKNTDNRYDASNNIRYTIWDIVWNNIIFPGNVQNSLNNNESDKEDPSLHHSYKNMISIIEKDNDTKYYTPMCRRHYLLQADSDGDDEDGNITTTCETKQQTNFGFCEFQNSDHLLELKACTYELLNQIIVKKMIDYSSSNSTTTTNPIFQPNGKNKISLAERLFAASLDELEGFLIPLLLWNSKKKIQCNQQKIEKEDEPKLESFSLNDHITPLILCNHIVKLLSTLCQTSHGFTHIRELMRTLKNDQNDESLSGIGVLIQVLDVSVRSIVRINNQHLPQDPSSFHYWNLLLEEIISFFYLLLCHVQILRQKVQKEIHAPMQNDDESGPNESSTSIASLDFVSFSSLIQEDRLVFCSACCLLLTHDQYDQKIVSQHLKSNDQCSNINLDTIHQTKALLEEIAMDDEEEEQQMNYFVLQ